MLFDKTKCFKQLNIFALILAGCVLLLGAYTRLTDAGLGCPDWPGCYGHLAVPHSLTGTPYAGTELEPTKAWTEMIHRYLASTLGLCILGLFALSRFNKNNLGQPKALPFVLLLLVIGQGLLGMWTVTLKLHPTIVMSHLLGGFTTLSLLWLMLLQQKQFQTSLPNYPKLKALALFSLACLCLQIFLGGWTSSNYAALICPDFPYCQGKLLPPMDFKEAFTLIQPIGPNFAGGLFENTARVTIHMAHRFGAVITTALLLTLIIGLLKTRQRLLKIAASIISGILLIQLSLGIINVVKLLPLPIAVMHHGFAALLLLALIKTNFLLWRQAEANK